MSWEIYNSIVNREKSIEPYGYHYDDETPVATGITEDGITWCISESNGAYIARFFAVNCNLGGYQINEPSEYMVKNPYYQESFYTLEEAAEFTENNIRHDYWQNV